MGGIKTMDVHNFRLNDIFYQNAKECVTRPVMAAKYQPGMENGWMVYFTNVTTKGRGVLMHEGMKFFPTEVEAWEYINADEKQYVEENGKLVEVKVSYDSPVPVLCTKDFDPNNKGGLTACIEGQCAFVSNETEDYEFEILEDKSWILIDMDGKIRVWHPDYEESFFGKSMDIVFEKDDDGEYRQIAV